MRRREGVVVFALVLFAAGAAAGAIHASGLPLSVSTSTTTTTAPPPATTTVTTSDTTTAVTTTTAAATTSAATTTAPAPKATPLVAAPLASPRCLALAGFALLEPGRAPLALGIVASPPRLSSASEGAVAYPADGSIVNASSLGMSAGGCGTKAHGGVEVASLSLFGGAVTVRTVELGVRGGTAGDGVTIKGLVVGSVPVAATPGRSIGIGSWGYVVRLAQPNAHQAGALAVHLTKTHAGLPAGTVLLVGFAQLAPRTVVPTHAAQPAAKSPSTRTHVAHTHVAKKKHVVHHVKKVPPKHAAEKRHVETQQLGDSPLTITPRLGLTGYVFPVAGEVSYGDSFGGYRGDVPGNYHHGDDLFAKLGTPVVAVANGTLNRIGWEHIGGWRLWVRDDDRNEFYYAHLSGYSPLALHSKYVKKGEVIGYVGNSGDAFTTPPHLHFEVHPHQLLRLDYNGAVDPTSYIDTWRHVTRPDAPLPVHPPFPGGDVHKEAAYIWRELLAARGVTAHAPTREQRPHVHVRSSDNGSVRRLAGARHREAAAPVAVARARHTSSMVPDVLAGIVLPALLFAGALTYRLRFYRA